MPTDEPTGRTDHANTHASSHGGEHAARDLRDRYAEKLTAACPHFTDDPECAELTAHALAAVRDTELDRLRAEAEEGWRAKDAAEEERDVQRALADAFAETADNQRQRAEKAEGLLEIALHLCRHGDLAPGGGETWADWARTTETHLRAKEAPDAR